MMVTIYIICGESAPAGWDRQPYIYRLNESQTDGKGELRISPLTQTIANNLIYTVNYNGQACGSIGE
jgi:hypothetical protein